MIGKVISTYEDVMEWVNAHYRVVIFAAIMLLAFVGAWTLMKKWIILAALIVGSIYVYRHWKDLRRTRIEDWFNPIKWVSVLYGWFAKLIFPLHIVEQIILRMYDMECRKCVKQGTCIHCGCDISKVHVPWESCSNGNWGPFVESKKKYQEMRKEFPVEITINYPKENA